MTDVVDHVEEDEAHEGDPGDDGEGAEALDKEEIESDLILDSAEEHALLLVEESHGNKTPHATKPMYR